MARNGASPESGAALPITIYSDVICPWCYIGKKRFEQALATPGMPQDTAITWRPFELNPDMPEEGMARADYRARKFGAEKSRALDIQMAETGRETGIIFAFDQMKVTPNTRLAHRLVWHAEREGRAAQNAIVERLFRGYFEEGCDIGKRDVLLDLAADVGLDTRSAGVVIDNDISLEAVLDLEDAGIRMGIRGVPMFILINKYAITGAQPADVWRDALPKIIVETAKSET